MGDKDAKEAFWEAYSDEEPDSSLSEQGGIKVTTKTRLQKLREQFETLRAFSDLEKSQLRTKVEVNLDFLIEDLTELERRRVKYKRAMAEVKTQGYSSGTNKSTKKVEKPLFVR